MRFATVHRLIEVEWIDISLNSGWHSYEAAKEMEVLHCTTVGYVVSHDKECLRMSMSLGDIRIDLKSKEIMVGLCGDICVIPSVCVKRFSYLTRGKMK